MKPKKVTGDYFYTDTSQFILIESIISQIEIDVILEKEAEEYFSVSSFMKTGMNSMSIWIAGML